MLIRTHIGISLDGLASSLDGLPAWDWKPGWDHSSPPPGYSDFMSNVGAVAMGRTCFDQGLKFWLDGWPWGDRPVVVMTHRPLPPEAPSTVQAAFGGPAGVVEALRATGVTSDVQLLGGPTAVHAFIEAGMLDRLGLVVLPIMLGQGIPMFSVDGCPFSFDRWQASTQKPDTQPSRNLRLETTELLEDGCVKLEYALA